MIGDDESADQALTLAVTQQTAEFQPITNLILINENPKMTQERFQIDAESIAATNQISVFKHQLENVSKPFQNLEVLQTMCIKHYESNYETSRSALVYPEAVSQNCLRNIFKIEVRVRLTPLTYIFFNYRVRTGTGNKVFLNHQERQQRAGNRHQFPSISGQGQCVE